MPETTEQTDDRRASYIAGLRQLADLLEQHEDMPLPWDGSRRYADLDWLFFDREEEQQKALMATLARYLPGQVEKNATGDYFHLRGRIAGLHVRAMASRDAVCVRRVVGTREVTRTVPDPSFDVPLVDVTETVEDVEWDCTPLLASALDGSR